MRILIVDDDFLVRSNLKRLIETSPLCRQQGFSVACEVTDGEQAMQMIRNGECGAFNPLLIECLEDSQSRIRYLASMTAERFS